VHGRSGGTIEIAGKPSFPAEFKILLLATGRGYRT
jgi:hypothetical protein